MAKEGVVTEIEGAEARSKAQEHLSKAQKHVHDIANKRRVVRIKYKGTIIETTRPEMYEEYLKGNNVRTR